MKTMTKHTTKLSRLSATVVLFLVLSCQGWGLSVSGVVLNIDGSPAQGRTVILHEQPSLESIFSQTDQITPTCNSDEAGVFFFSNVTAGTYFLNVLPAFMDKQDRNTQRFVAITLGFLTNSISDITLKPVNISTYNIYGRVSSINNGSPIQARIVFTPKSPATAASDVLYNHDLLKSVNTDETGAFIKHNLSAGQYLATIQTTVLDRIPLNITIHAQGEIQLETIVVDFLAQADVQLRMQAVECSP